MDCIVFFPGVSSFLDIMARNRRITMLSITRKYNCSHFLQSEYLTNTRACFPVLPRTASPHLHTLNVLDDGVKKVKTRVS